MFMILDPADKVTIFQFKSASEPYFNCLVYKVRNLDLYFCTIESSLIPITNRIQFQVLSRDKLNSIVQWCINGDIVNGFPW